MSISSMQYICYSSGIIKLIVCIQSLWIITLGFTDHSHHRQLYFRLPHEPVILLSCCTYALVLRLLYPSVVQCWWIWRGQVEWRHVQFYIVLLKQAKGQNKTRAYRSHEAIWKNATYFHYTQNACTCISRMNIIAITHFIWWIFFKWHLLEVDII